MTAFERRLKRAARLVRLALEGEQREGGYEPDTNTVIRFRSLFYKHLRQQISLSKPGKPTKAKG